MATLLPDFVSIGPRISTYTPSSPVAGHLIIMCTWLGAARKHIVKYTAAYQRLVPHARILLVESDLRIVTSRYAKQGELIKHAVSIVLDTLADCGYHKSTSEIPLSQDLPQELSSSSSSAIIGKPPKILLHVFSNGGTNSATQLLLALHKRSSQPLPLAGLLFDSCPAKGTYWKNHNAMALSLRPKDAISRFLVAILVHGVLIILYSWIAWGNDNPATLDRRTLLDENLLAASSSDENKERMSACYLFSEADQQVDWMDIKEHAEDARRKGWRVSEVVFEGSGHCAHFSVDGERYQEAMKMMWLGSGEERLETRAVL